MLKRKRWCPKMVIYTDTTGHMAIGPLIHRSYMSHTHPTGHKPIYLSHAHPTGHTPSYLSHTYPIGRTPLLLVTYPSY